MHSTADTAASSRAGRPVILVEVPLDASRDGAEAPGGAPFHVARCPTGEDDVSSRGVRDAAATASAAEAP